jgi:hypothetical protein
MSTALQEPEQRRRAPPIRPLYAAPAHKQEEKATADRQESGRTDAVADLTRAFPCVHLCACTSVTGIHARRHVYMHVSMGACSHNGCMHVSMHASLPACNVPTVQTDQVCMSASVCLCLPVSACACLCLPLSASVCVVRLYACTHTLHKQERAFYKHIMKRIF